MKNGYIHWNRGDMLFVPISDVLGNVTIFVPIIIVIY